MRTFEKTFGMRLVRQRQRLDHARDAASDSVDHDHRGELAPGQHEVADRELLVDVTFDHALVDALVVPAHDHQMRELREPPRRRLVEEGALRAHENDATAPPSPRTRPAAKSRESGTDSS